MTDLSMFSRFESALRSSTEFSAQDPRLLIRRDHEVSTFYAPFEHVNHAAKVVIVGITPGPTQMEIAVTELQRRLRDGDSPELALEAAKHAASFGGDPMRSNLSRQLNHWGIHHWLTLRDSSELFMSSGRHLLHATSILRYPVFSRNRPYAGVPDCWGRTSLREQILEFFVPEIRELPDALFFPLGPQVAAIMQKLVEKRVLREDRLFTGMLHPSGQNSYRVQYLSASERAGAPPHRTNALAYDAGRRRFQEISKA